MPRRPASAGSRFSDDHRGRQARRHGLHVTLFAVVAALAGAALVGPDLFPARTRTLGIVLALATAAFVAGWLCRGRRPALGGWIGGGAVASVLTVGLTAGLALELERRQELEGQQRLLAALGSSRQVEGRLGTRVEELVSAAESFERRAEETWAPVLPLGLALAPAWMAGVVGAVLGANRRSKRRPLDGGATIDGALPLLVEPDRAVSDATLATLAQVYRGEESDPVMARDLRLDARRQPPSSN